MSNDLVVLFNRLTSSKLADYSLFGDILEYHYEKFKLFYRIFKKIDLRKIEEIYGTNIDNDSLQISIIASDNKYISDMLGYINKFNMEKYSWCVIETSTTDSTLVVNMSLIDDLFEEGDLYAN